MDRTTGITSRYCTIQNLREDEFLPVFNVANVEGHDAVQNIAIKLIDMLPKSEKIKLDDFADDLRHIIACIDGVSMLPNLSTTVYLNVFQTEQSSLNSTLWMSRDITGLMYFTTSNSVKLLISSSQVFELFKAYVNNLFKEHITMERCETKIRISMSNYYNCLMRNSDWFRTRVLRFYDNL